MNELNLSISTGKDNNKVVLTAAFESHLEAVRFHAAVADLCEKANNGPKNTNPMAITGMRLLGRK